MSRRKKIYLYLSLLLAVGVLLPTVSTRKALASTATSNLSVTATVVAGCLVSPGQLDFGSYNAGGPPQDASTIVTIQCSSPSTSWTLDADGGQNGPPGPAPGPGTPRFMKHGAGDLLGYNLYTDSNHTTVFGTSLFGSSITGTGNVQPNIYGRIGGTQVPAAGPYTDTVVLTLTF